MTGQGKAIVGMVLAALFSSGCQYHTYAPPPNKAPTDVTVNDPAPVPSSQPHVMDDSTGPAVQAPGHYEEILSTQGVSYATVKNEVLAPMAKYVLDAKALATPSFISSDAFFRYLRIYHQALLTAANLGPDQPEVAEAFKNYEATVLAPCLENRNQCATLRTMAKESRYTQVIMKTIEVLKLDPEKAWKYSFYAQDFSGVPLSDNYQAQFYANLTDYLQGLVATNKTSAAKIADAAEKFNSVVMSTNSDSPALQGFLDKIDIWSQDGKNADLALDPSLRQTLRQAIWNNLIRTQALKADGTPTASFARWIKSEMANFDKDVLAPFQQDEITKRIWSSFNLTDPRIPADPKASDQVKKVLSTLFFILDQSFGGKLQREDALSLLAVLNPPEADVIQVSQAYVRVRFARMMLATQLALKASLGSPDHYKNMRELQESLESANKMQVQWAGFLGQLNSLRDIVETTAATHDTEMTPDLKDRLSTTFGQMDRDIKWFVTYPNMLPVLYYISKANLVDELDILWFRINLNSDFIFRLLINGNLGMWFNFTNSMEDDANFTTPEVLFAFRNALNSELFSTYGIQPGSFLLELIDRLLNQANVALDNASASVYRKLSVGQVFTGFSENTKSNAFMDAMKFCNGQPVTETIRLEDLPNHVVSFQEPLTNTISNLAVFDMSMAGFSDREDWTFDVLNDHLRTDHFYPLQVIEKMVTIYKDYLAHYNLKDDTMPIVDQKLAQIHQRMRKYFGLEYQALNLYTPCLFHIADTALGREFKLLDYEKRYLQGVYKDMVALRANPSRLNEINAQNARDYGALGPSQDHAEIRDGHLIFVYNQLDFIMRLKENLQQGMTDPATKEQLAAVAPGMVISIPSNPKVAGRFYQLLSSRDQSLVVTLDPNDDEQSFLKKTMIVFFNNMGYKDYKGGFTFYPFENWFASGGFQLKHAFSLPREHTEATLMKIGPVEAYDFQKPGCDARKSFDDLDKDCVTTMSITPDQVFAENKRILDLITLKPEQVPLLEDITTDPMLGAHAEWYNVFFSEADDKPIGLLDAYLFMASRQTLADNLQMPGYPVDYSHGQPIPRTGSLDQATIYFKAFGSHAPNFLTTPDSLDGHLLSMYKGLVDHEFSLSTALEAKAAQEEAAHPAPFELKLTTTLPPYQIPVRTSFAQPSNASRQQFNSATDFIFAN